MLASLLDTLKALVPDPLRELWERTRPAHGVAAFLAGLVYYFATVQHLETLRDNLWLGVALLQLVICLVAELRLERALPVPNWVASVGGWWTWGTQSAVGSVLGVALVHFTRGARPGVAVLVAGVVVGVLALNRFAPAHLSGSRTRLLLLWVCTYAVSLFSLPLVTGWLGYGVNVLAGSIASSLCVAVVFLVESRAQLIPEMLRHALGQGMVAGAFALAGALQLLPPVPLSLEHVQVVHEVERRKGAWTLRWDGRRGAQGRVLVSEKVRPVEVYTRVFAPAGFEIDVVHVWMHWDGGWKEMDRIRHSVKGGGSNGYRGLSRKSRPKPGRWRVRIEDGRGRRMGAVSFRVVHGETLVERTHQADDGRRE